nr:hypothetical protein [Petrotoga olearia]
MKDRTRLFIYIPNHIQPIEYITNKPNKPEIRSERPFLNLRKLMQIAAPGKETKNPPEGPKM